MDVSCAAQEAAPQGQGEGKGVGRCRSTLRCSLPTQAGLGLLFGNFLSVLI